MVQIRRFLLAALVVTLAGLGITAEAQRRPYRITDQQVGQIISRIESRTDVYRQSLDATLDRSRYDGTRTEDDINSFVREFENATDQLRDRFNRRQSVVADVQQVLDRAAVINSFMQRNRVGARASRDWATLRTDLNELANAYGVNWNWNDQSYPSGGTSYPSGTTSGNPYRVGDQELRQLIMRIGNRADRFRTSVSSALNNSRYDGRNRENNVNDFVSSFEEATNRLRDNFNNRQSTTADVQEVLNRAARIDRFMQRNQLDTRAENDWSLLRTDLNTLASYYNVTWNWDGNTGGGGIGTGGGGIGGGGAYGANRLTGTYRLDTTRSDDARDAAQRATRTLPYRDRQRVLDALTARLESPDQLAIDRRGNSVTIASTRSPQITFDADGRVADESLGSGRTARVSATLSGDQLVVSSNGTRDTDFSVTFEPIENGRRLRVTRRISDINLSSPVVVQSTYDKTSEAARFDIYTGPQNYPNSTTTTTTASGEFVVPNGTQLVTTLNTNLNTREMRENDRFTLNVVSPSPYDGAVIEGYVSNVSRSGRISGRSGLTLNFDSIRMRDGRSYRFAGIVDTVRTAGGETVRVDNEGAVQENDSRGNTTAKRAAIGTAVGAIIGAIAGGGKGAAIGAVVGAGAGAGSVYVQGQDDLELTNGTEITVRSTGPNNR